MGIVAGVHPGGRWHPLRVLGIHTARAARCGAHFYADDTEFTLQDLHQRQWAGSTRTRRTGSGSTECPTRCSPEVPQRQPSLSKAAASDPNAFHKRGGHPDHQIAPFINRSSATVPRRMLIKHAPFAFEPRPAGPAKAGTEKRLAMRYPPARTCAARTCGASYTD